MCDSFKHREKFSDIFQVLKICPTLAVSEKWDEDFSSPQINC